MRRAAAAPALAAALALAAAAGPCSLTDRLCVEVADVALGAPVTLWYPKNQLPTNTEPSDLLLRVYQGDLRSAPNTCGPVDPLVPLAAFAAPLQLGADDPKGFAASVVVSIPPSPQLLAAMAADNRFFFHLQDADKRVCLTGPFQQSGAFTAVALSAPEAASSAPTAPTASPTAAAPAATSTSASAGPQAPRSGTVDASGSSQMPTIAIAGIVAATALVALIVITGLVLLRRFRRDARGRFVDEEGIEKLRPSNGGSAAGVPAPSRASISSLASSVSLDPAAAHQPLSGLSRLAPMSGPSPGHKSVKHASPSAFQMPAGFHIQQQQLSQLQATLPLSQMHSQQAPPASSAPFVAFVSKQPPRDISFGSSVVSATSSTAASTLIAPTSVAGSASVSPSLLSATPVPSGYAIPVPTSSPPREDIFADPADATPTQSSVALQQLQQQQQQQQRQTQPKKISATAFSSEDARLIAQAFRQELIDPSHDWETHSDTSSMAASRQSSKVSQKSNRSSLSNPFGTGSRPVNSTDEGSAQ